MSHNTENPYALLYIETSGNPTANPIYDELFENLQMLLRKAEYGSFYYTEKNPDRFDFSIGGAWRGVHITKCGKCAGNKDYLIGKQTATNLLAPYYVSHYRSEIPNSEWLKLKNLFLEHGLRWCDWELNN
jgi:hypothetical protein